MKKLIGLLCLFPLFAGGQTLRESQWNIVYIGNSITQGVQLNSKREAPPVQASLWLQKQEHIGAVAYSNQGVSGKTTVDFLPETGTFFEKVKVAADLFKDDPHATLLFSIMLGTNDSAIRGPNGSPVSSIQYYTNLKRIIDALLELYPRAKVVVHGPIWYSPNTYNSSMYLQEGLERLTDYREEIVRLTEDYQLRYSDTVFLGDTAAYAFFKEHATTYFIPEEGNAGTFYLHPNKQGAAKLGEFWGRAIYAVITRLNE